MAFALYQPCVLTCRPLLASLNIDAILVFVPVPSDGKEFEQAARQWIEWFLGDDSYMTEGAEGKWASTWDEDANAGVARRQQRAMG